MKKSICFIVLICMLLSTIPVLGASEALGYNITTEKLNGEIIIPVTETTGTWSKSSAVPNYDGSAHMYTMNDNDSAIFKIEGVKPGNYECFFWLLPHVKNGRKFTVEIHHNGKLTSNAFFARIADNETLAPGWVSVGVADISGDGTEKVVVTNPNGILRVGGIKLVPTDKALSESIPLPEETPTEQVAPQPSGEEILIPVTATVGEWTDSTIVPNYDGNAHMYTLNANDSATFKIEGVKPGNYECFYWLLPHVKNGKKFTVNVHHNGKITANSFFARITEDETVAPHWESVGVVDIAGIEGEEVVVTNPGGILRVGGIKLTPTNKPLSASTTAVTEEVLPEGLTRETFAGEIVIPYTETTGSWRETSSVAGYNGGSHLYAEVLNATMTFKIPAVTPSNYEIYYWVMPHTRNTTYIDLTVHHNGKSSTLLLKERFGESEVPGWRSMGVFDLKGDGNESVVLLNNGGIIRGSAIKIVPTDKPLTVLPEKFVDTVKDPREPLKPWQPDAEKEAFLSSVAGAPNPRYTLMFADEFDGPISMDTWHYRLDEKNGGKNLAANAYAYDGRMYHDVVYTPIAGEEIITGAGIISNKLFGYGYYEFKGTLDNSTGGLHSAFWVHGSSDSEYTKDIANLHTQELDFEFNSDRPYVACNYYCSIRAKLGFYNQIMEGFNTNEEHIYGLEWLPDRVNYYVDGELVFSKNGEEAHLHYAQQFLWITSLAWETGDTPADKAKLPMQNSFDYVRYYAMPLKDINLLGASEFEYNDNPDYGTAPVTLQNPIAWGEIGDKDASKLERNDELAATGNHVLAHRSDKDYKVTTFQTLYFIPNGTHNFEVYAMSSGGQNEAKIRISDFDGTTTKEIDIPKSDKMVKLTLDGIEVKDNQVTVEFISDAKADQWILLDNPSFYAVDGEVVDKHRPYITKYENVFLGEMYTQTIHDKGFKSDGIWNKSTLAGYLNSNTAYSYAEDGPASATFTIEAPKDGLFNIRFYKLIHENTGTNCHVFYEVNGQNRKDTGLDLTQGAAGWEILGTENLKKGDIVTVTIDKEYGGLIRSSAAALTSTNMLSVEDVLILELGDRYVWTFGEKLQIDQNNPDIRPKTVNDRTMVPIRFIAEALGATVSYIEETEEIVIELGENRITLKVGSNIMTVNGAQKTLDAAAFVEEGRTLVPVRAVSEGLGKTVTWVPDKYIIIGDIAYANDADMFAQIDAFDKQ